METVERLLKEQFTDPESTVSLDRTVKLARVRRGQRRRTTTMAAAVGVVVVVAGGVAVAATPGGGNRPQVAAPHGTAERTFTTIEGPEFVDRSHGYVHLLVCTETSEGSPPGPGTEAVPGTLDCKDRLLRTADGGRSWQDRTLPMQTVQKDGGYMGPTMKVIGSDVIAVTAPDRSQRWVSRDAGKTWAEVPVTPTATVAAAPPDALLDVAPDDASTGPGVLTVTAADGTLSRLAHGPADVVPKGSGSASRRAAILASDGSRWLACETPARQGCVVTTADGGAHWQTRQMDPMAAGESLTSSFSTVDGRTVCVVVQAGAGDGVSAIARLYRSVDGGLHWTTVALPALAPNTENRLVHGIGGAEVLANGDVILAADGTLYRLRPGGDRFQKLSRTPTDVTQLGRSGPWLVATSFDGASGKPIEDRRLFALSQDGVNWTDVRLP
jgi:photosystem II stability/assembly factor-like uncharacterized protein